MANSMKWPIKSVNVIDISLDLENVRLRNVEPYEADILSYLYQYEDALSLARDIVRLGFFASDLPIVTYEGSRLIVLEGNRRIAALRGLANPSSVPNFYKQLTKLRSQMSDDALADVEEINVAVAPSRESAQPLIASIHTRSPKKSWPLDQQAQFFYSQLNPTRTVEDLQNDYPTVAAEIPRSIRMAEMYELVRKADLGSQDLQTFVESKQFKLSTFERLYQSKRFQELLALDFSADGRLKARGDQARLNRVLAYVVEDMRSGFLTTRRLGTQNQSDFVRYLNDVERFAQDDKTDTAATESPNAPQEQNGQSENAPQEQAAGSQSESAPSRQSGSSGAPASRKGSRQASKLDSKGIAFNLNSQASARRYNELISLNFRTFPNATMDLIRTVLECALKAYFIEIDNPVPERRNGAPVTLADALTHALAHFRDDKQLSTRIASLKTAPVNEAQYSKSAYVLNAVNHDPDVFFNAVEVQEMWDSIRPLLAVLVGYTDPEDSKA